MFAGLISRWTKPIRWAWPRASAISATIRADSRWEGRSRMIRAVLRRLGSPVAEAPPVGVARGLGDLGHDPCRFSMGRAVPLDPGRQVHALDPLGHDEAGAAVLAHVMDRHDVRVLQPG